MNYSDLLKLKHLFFLSITSKIDYKKTLSHFGITGYPTTMDALDRLMLKPREIKIIRKLYNTSRRVQETESLSAHANSYIFHQIHAQEIKDMHLL